MVTFAMDKKIYFNPSMVKGWTFVNINLQWLPNNLFPFPICVFQFCTHVSNKVVKLSFSNNIDLKLYIIKC
jgi:hypothetical protein